MLTHSEVIDLVNSFSDGIPLHHCEVQKLIELVLVSLWQDRATGTLTLRQLLKSEQGRLAIETAINRHYAEHDIGVALGCDHVSTYPLSLSEPIPGGSELA